MIHLADITQAVAEHYKLHPLDLTGHCRERAFAHPRQMAYALCRDLTPPATQPSPRTTATVTTAPSYTARRRICKRVRNEENVCRAHCQIHRSIKAADNLEFRSVRGGA